MDIRLFLNSEGIAHVPNIYSLNEIAALNRKLDPLFAARSAQDRSYVRPDDMCDLKIVRDVLSPRMMDVLFRTVPDPVLYHLHFYEIAARKENSHIFSENLLGWHRDPDSGYFPDGPAHVSVFVYLNDVGPDDGPFEFVPNLPCDPLFSGAAAASMQGPAGASFVWHRNFYHRAAPNRGAQRRRLLKISTISNKYKSVHLRKAFFNKLINTTPKGDPRMDLLVGRYQGGQGPALDPAADIPWSAVDTSYAVTLSAKMQKTLVKQEEASKTEEVEYD